MAEGCVFCDHDRLREADLYFENDFCLRRKSRFLRGRSRLGESFEFGGNLGGLGRPDLLEDLQRLPQHVSCPGGVVGGQSAPAQAGQRMSLIPGAAGLAGEVQGLLVA
jgi:hypothetical protein